MKRRKKPGQQGVGYDEFGNPEGEMFDLGGGDEERVRGERILFYTPGPNWYGHEWHLAQQAVADRGFSMDIMHPKDSRRCSLDEKVLGSYSQLWFVSSERVTLNDHQVKLIGSYVRHGNGLLIWADNEPYLADANRLAREIVGTEFSGDKPGEGILVPGETLAPGRFVEHALTHGINRLHEGHTISTIAPGEHITILAQSHDRQYCMACFEHRGHRVVLDTGFTKLMEGRFYRTPGTARYFRNIAFWLSRGARGYQYKRFTPGRESLATIDPKGVSERYVYNVTYPTSLTYILHWQGQGALGLLIQDPRGQVVHDSATSSPPIRLEIPANVTGPWSCWVKGINIPHADFPYVLTLAVKTDGIDIKRPSAVEYQGRAKPTPAKRVPIYILVDASLGASDVVPFVERAIRALTNRLRARPSHGAQAAMSILVASRTDPVVVPLTEMPAFTPPALSARGGMMLGSALRGLLQSVSKDKRETDSKPIVVILLSCAPTDDWISEAAQLRRLAEQKQANVFAVALGAFADARLLSQLSPVGPLTLKSVVQAEIEQLFDWLYQVVDVMLCGLEQGTGGQSLGVPPLPVCVTFLQ